MVTPLNGSVSPTGFKTVAPQLYVKGLNPVPVGRDKRPPLGWKRWQDARTSPAELSDMLDRFPGLGTAIVLGGPCLSTIDVDVDSAEGEQALSESGLPLPETWEWASERGRHRVYITACRDLPDWCTPFPGVEFRFHGHYTVAAPSFGRTELRGINALAPLPPEIEGFLRAAATALQLQPLPPNYRGHQGYSIPSDLEVPDITQVPTEPEEGTGWVAAALRDGKVLALVAGRLGAPVGRGFACPWHHDRKASAQLWVPPDGQAMYRCFGSSCGLTLSLPEVYSSSLTGRLVRPRGALWMVWALRLLYDAGVVHVQHAGLPEGVPESVKPVLEGWYLLRALRKSGAFRTDVTESTYANPFIQAWCGVGMGQAWNGVRWMRGNGILVPTGRKAGWAALYRLEAGH